MHVAVSQSPCLFKGPGPGANCLHNLLQLPAAVVSILCIYQPGPEPARFVQQACSLIQSSWVAAIFAEDVVLMKEIMGWGSQFKYALPILAALVVDVSIFAFLSYLDRHWVAGFGGSLLSCFFPMISFLLFSSRRIACLAFIFLVLSCS